MSAVGPIRQGVVVRLAVGHVRSSPSPTGTLLQEARTASGIEATPRRHILPAVYVYLYSEVDGQGPLLARVVTTRPQGFSIRGETNRRLPTAARATGARAERLEASADGRSRRARDPHPHRDGAPSLHVARFAEAIYVLHAFEKRSQKTARGDVEVARTRYQALIAWRREQGYGR